MTIGLACLGVLLGQTPKPPEVAKVRGYVIVSSDPAFVKKAREAPGFDGPYAEFAKGFPSPRARVVPWGDDYAIVFDLQSGLFAWYHDRAVLLDALIDKVGQDRVLHLGDLGPAQVAALGNVLGRPTDPATHEPLVPTALGLQLSTSIVAAKDGATHTIRSLDEHDYFQMRGALENEKRDSDARRRATGTKPAPLPEKTPSDDIRLTAVAGVHKISEGMERAAPLVREITAELRSENEKRFARLMAKLGGGDAPSLTGTITRNKVGESQWRAYEDAFAHNWQGEFANEADARAFFQGSDSVRLGTTLSLEQIFDLRTPNRPGSGYSMTIATVPGVFAP